ncbi:AAA family ATPase [Dongia sp. agr-C8]
MNTDWARASRPKSHLRIAKDGDVGRFPLVRLREIQPNLEGRYRVKGLLQSTGLHNFWGPPKCGKTFLVLDLVAHVACGMPYRGLRVRQGAVLYIAAEGVEGFRARALAWCREHLEDDADPPLYVLGMRVDLMADHRGLIDAARLEMADEVPAVVVVDTLNRTFTGSESSDEDMTAYVAAADAIREAFGSAVIIVHHCGHDASRPRGHTALMGAVDVQVAVKKDEATKIITAEVEFAKDMADGLVLSSKLKVVDLGVDEDGDPVTTCIIEATEEAPKAKSIGPKLTPPCQLAFAALKQAIGEAGAIPPASNHIPSNIPTVALEFWKKVALMKGVSEGSEDANRKAFGRAAEKLQAAGYIGVWNGQVWPAEARS